VPVIHFGAEAADEYSRVAEAHSVARMRSISARE
jgi:hypothetical protein